MNDTTMMHDKSGYIRNISNDALAFLGDVLSGTILPSWIRHLTARLSSRKSGGGSIARRIPRSASERSRVRLIRLTAH